MRGLPPRSSPSGGSCYPPVVAPACLLHGLWWCSSSGIWGDTAESDTSVAKSVSTAVESSFPAIAKPEKMKVSSL